MSQNESHFGRNESNKESKEEMGSRTWSAGYWLGVVALLFLTGCPKRASVSFRPMTKSSRPVLQMLSHKGNHVRYKIYNTSGKSFSGLAVVIDGKRCDGPRSRRLLIHLSRPPLAHNTVRPFSHRMPFICRTVRLTAYDLPGFNRVLAKRHHPLVRYSFKERIVTYQVENRSILPFRGIAVVIRGQECEDGPSTRYWVSGTRLWLYPGYKRSFTKRITVDCLRVQVVAKDLLAFIKSRRTFLKTKRAKQKQLRQDAKKLLQSPN